ncbi:MULTISPECIES: TetR/AcrR family transcriptional regulator [Streptomyces]|uniref:TetR/AcrR family transcriptional regulator C-terminal domain-containing protein n=1 Tax=Streptomyces siderophoricus TaxID=2802281 RepID=A0ABS1MIE9_9ACTN|nr:TetR/AcrR family transcriptional regulator [Streptomyces sp. 9-7]MBL1087834.1 TetR/AcrR family transcriptional regulator C-terminal domain-containing protein [Streptomyces sp. 9-7]
MADAAKEPAPPLVWTKDRRTPRRQAPSVDQIVRTALAIADAEGLSAVSMRRVASELRSGTASLYRYVASRDELLDLMINEVHRAEEPPALTGEWRTDLGNVARQVRAGLLRHPWLGTELTGRPALGAHSLRHHEVALTAAAALTPDITLATRVVHTVLAYVHGATTHELAESRTQQRTGLTKEQWRASVGPYMRKVIEGGGYPQLARRVIEAEDTGPDELFEFGLRCVLDGVGALAD